MKLKCMIFRSLLTIPVLLSTPAFGAAPGLLGELSGTACHAAMQRLDWTGKVPCEIQTMHARPDGFELHFTSPIDAATASDPGSCILETFTHHYHGAYGSPELGSSQTKGRLYTMRHIPITGFLIAPSAIADDTPLKDCAHRE